MRSSHIRRYAYILREFIHTYIWKRRVQASTSEGFTLTSGSYAANRQMLRGNFEAEEVAIIKEHLGKCQVFVDVGANIGFYTCLALRAGRHTLAIEPKRSNLDLLYRNILLNRFDEQAEVYPVGLSERPGLFRLYGATGTAASLLKGWAGHLDVFSETIPIITMDSLVAHPRFRGQSMLIKVDVEGAEYHVLRGAAAVLARPEPTAWLIEICLSEYHPEKINPNYYDTFAIMWDHGYTAYAADRERRLISRGQVAAWVKQGHGDPGFINYLFVNTAFASNT